MTKTEPNQDWTWLLIVAAAFFLLRGEGGDPSPGPVPDPVIEGTTAELAEESMREYARLAAEVYELEADALAANPERAKRETPQTIMDGTKAARELAFEKMIRSNERNLTPANLRETAEGFRKAVDHE